MAITAELHDGRVLEFPDGTDAAVIQRTVKKMLGVSADAQASTSTPSEKPPAQQFMQNLAGSIIGGAGGIGSALVELGKTGPHGEPLSSLADRVRARNAAVEGALSGSGVETDSGTYGVGKFATQALGTAGVGPAMAAGVRALPIALPKVANALASGGFTTGGARTAGDFALRAGAGGAVGGASALLTSSDDVGSGAGVGAGLATVLPPVLRGGSKAIEYGVDKIGRPLSNLFTKDGPMNIARNYLNTIVGEGNMPAILARTRNAEELITGSKPTVGEAIAGLPEGSPVNALQNIVAKTSGGPSADFGNRLLQQKAALTAAEEARSAVTTPMREAALEAANAGGVRSEAILSHIDEMSIKPGDRASDVVQKTLGAVRAKIAALTGESGVVNAQDLYTVRKEVGNTIQTFSKETANWDKRLTSKLEREIQLGIDEAIEKAGGKGWKAYLAEFSSRSKAIEADEARRLLAGADVQPTNLAGGLNVSEQTRPHTPNLLSRPAMVLNFILKGMSKNVEPKVDAALSRILLDPSQFTAEMSKLPPKTRIEVERLLQRGNLLQGAAAATNQP